MPQSIIHNDFKIFYNKLGALHRLDGPAVDLCSNKQWWCNGKLHRVDGPAIEMSNGHKEWWIHGCQFFSKESWFKALNRDDQIAYVFNIEGAK